LALASLAAVAAISTAVHATVAAVTAVASLASVAVAAAEIVAEVAAPPSRRYIMAEAARFAVAASPSVTHIATHRRSAGTRMERSCCGRCWSIVRRLPHEADGLSGGLVSALLVTVTDTLCPSLRQLVLDHLRLRAHCSYPRQIAQFILDEVRCVQASEDAGALRVVTAGLLDGDHNAPHLLVFLLAHACHRQLGQQRLEAGFHRRPALRRFPAESLELRLQRHFVGPLVANEVSAQRAQRVVAGALVLRLRGDDDCADLWACDAANDHVVDCLLLLSRHSQLRCVLRPLLFCLLWVVCEHMVEVVDAELSLKLDCPVHEGCCVGVECELRRDLAEVLLNAFELLHSSVGGARSSWVVRRVCAGVREARCIVSISVAVVLLRLLDTVLLVAVVSSLPLRGAGCRR